MAEDLETKGGDRIKKSGAVRQAERLRAKNVMLLIALLISVALVYFVSIVRMGGS